MKLLITGGSGFVGKNFIELCGDNHIITAPTHKKVDLTKSAAVSKLFGSEYFDAVLHLADAVPANKNAHESANFKMFSNIQQAVIRQRMDKIVILGSGHEYGVRRHLWDVLEEEIGVEVPTDAYGVSKYLVNSLAVRDRITTNLRHFVVFGKYAEPYTNIVSALAYYAAAGRDIVLERDKTVSLIYVNDSVKVIDAALCGRLQAKDYNVVATQRYKLSQIARTLRTISGNTFDVIVEDKKDRDYDYTANNMRLTEAMPDLKFTPLKRALSELFLWIYDEFSTFNPARLQKLPDTI